MESQKEKQAWHTNKTFAELKQESFEYGIYHDYFREIPFKKLKQLLDARQVDLSQKKVLVASCGNGIDLYYLKKYYDAEYHVSDIAENAVNWVVRTFEGIEGRVEDNESMSYADDTFDYSFVAASLHHLPQPLKGVYELLRVSRKGLIFIEPNDSWLTRLATRMKLATEYEVSGNYVYRFSQRDIYKISKALHYKHFFTRCFAIHRIARCSTEFNILKILNELANFFIAPLGNYIICCIEKR